MNQPTLDLEKYHYTEQLCQISKETFYWFLMTTKCFKTVCNRIIELTPKGVIDRDMTYDEYLEEENKKSKNYNNKCILKLDKLS